MIAAFMVVASPLPEGSTSMLRAWQQAMQSKRRRREAAFIYLSLCSGLNKAMLVIIGIHVIK
jgi:hypothetical protein